MIQPSPAHLARMASAARAAQRAASTHRAVTRVAAGIGQPLAVISSPMSEASRTRATGAFARHDRDLVALVSRSHIGEVR